MEYLLTLAIMIGINAILASSFNLILGYGGLISIAHPIFYALGGYSSALIAINFSVPIPVAIAMGAIVAGALSVGLSLPSLRVSGDYLVIASIGFHLGILHIINNVEFTGAAGGLSDIPALVVGPNRSMIFAVVTTAVALLSILLIRWLVNGPYGRAISAMRDDEDAFSALGRNPVRIKVALFAVGSGLAGLAGGLYAHFFLYLTPDQFGIFASAALLTMVVFGGAGTIWGPAIGALCLTLLPEAISFLDLPVSVMAPLQGVIFTTLVIVFLFVRPQGLAGKSTRIARLGTASTAPGAGGKPLNRSKMA